MRKFKFINILIIPALLFGLLLTNFDKAYAASFSVSGPSSVAPGSSFKVTISANGDGKFNYSTSNGSGSGSVWIVGSTTVNITAGQSGTTSVTVTAVDATGYDESPITGSKTVSVVIRNGSSSNGGSSSNKKPAQEKPNQSSDNTLSSLSISTGELNPVFSPDITEYNVALPGDSTAISINASAKDSKATVSGTGEKTLKPGTNPFVISVTAENGAVKNYTVNVNVDETPNVFVPFNDVNLGVVRNTEGIGLPESFEQTTVTIDGNEVIAWTSNLMEKTIVYLQNEAGEKNFYLYEQDKGIVSIFKPTAILGNNVYIIDLSEEQQKLDGLTYTELEIDGQKLMGFKFNDPAFVNYSVIYVMNESGQMVYYQHESTQNTLQLYANGAPVSRENYEKLIQDHHKKTTMLMIVAGVGVLTAFAAVAWVIVVNKKRTN